MSDRAEMNEGDSQFLRHLTGAYDSGWFAAKRVLRRRKELLKEDNFYEENSEEWHGFNAFVEYHREPPVE